MTSKAIVFYGSDSAFEELLRNRIDPDEVTVRYLESVRVYNSRIRGNEGAAYEGGGQLPSKVDNCVVRSSDYGSVVSHAISNFACVLEGAFDFGIVYVQNPPCPGLRLPTGCLFRRWRRVHPPSIPQGVEK